MSVTKNKSGKVFGGNILKPKFTIRVLLFGFVVFAVFLSLGLKDFSRAVIEQRSLDELIETCGNQPETKLSWRRKNTERVRSIRSNESPVSSFQLLQMTISGELPPPVVEISISGSGINGKVISLVDRFPDLRKLRLGSWTAPVTVPVRLNQLPLDRLEVLHICNTGAVEHFDTKCGNNLKSISISNCEGIDQFNWLGNYPQLEELSLYDGKLQLSEFHSLSGLKNLTLGGDNLEIVGSFFGSTAAKSLKALRLDDCRIEDCQCFRGLERLESCVITHCPSLRSISSLSSLPKMKRLHIQDCPSLNLLQLDAFEQIETLELWLLPREQMAALDKINGMRSLERLDIHSRSIPSIRWLAQLPRLVEAYLALHDCGDELNQDIDFLRSHLREGALVTLRSRSGKTDIKKIAQPPSQ